MATEDFADDTLQDPRLTSTNWSAAEEALILAWRQKQFRAIDSGLVGSDITPGAQSTLAVALRDVDGDGDPDLVAGNLGQANCLYLNDDAPDPVNGFTGSNITADAHDTATVALGMSFTILGTVCIVCSMAIGVGTPCTILFSACNSGSINCHRHFSLTGNLRY